MTRVRFDVMPPLYEEARRVIDENFRALRAVLANGIRLREQFAGVIDTTIDVSLLPLAYDVPNLFETPTTVLLLRAIEQRTQSGIVVSGGVIEWEWRNGRLVLHSVDALSAGTRYSATLAVMV